MRTINADNRARVRKIIVYGIYIVLLSSIQVSFPEALGFWGKSADLMFVFVVLTGYFNGFWDGAAVGLISGMIRDVFSPPAVVGLDGEVRVTAFLGALILFVAGITGALFFSKKMHRNIPFSLVAVIFVTFCYKVTGYLVIFAWSTVAGASSSIVSPLTGIVYSLLPQLLLNAIAAVPLILFIRFLGPVSFRGASKKDEVIEKQGDNTWLGI